MAVPSLPFSFESLGTEIDRFISELGTYAADYLPLSDETKNTIRNVIPKTCADISVDVTETDTQFIITCDIPGVEKENITIRLLNPTTVLIKTAVSEDTETADGENYYLRERKLCSGERTITLPAKAAAEGAKATFKNGIMELILPKCVPEEGTLIEIE
ncbi:MAG TPA: Hsp20/alpha crystallin family protein [Methanocorpusculum sp.]|nr:Hsp20/alpha crystallin family protein [Methanocorpusculum sp.]